MTLILATGNRDFAMVVSDRRLSTRGRMVDDEANKAAQLTLKDARVVLAFTGLASVPKQAAVPQGFRTEDWLTSALVKVAAPDFLLRPTIDRLREAASATIGGLRIERADRGLTIVVAGYCVGAPAVPNIYVLTNLDIDGSVKPTFDLRDEPRGDVGDDTVLAAEGTTAGVTPEALEELRLLVREHKPIAAVLGKSLSIMRIAADSPKSRNTVGRQFTSVVLPADSSKMAASRYHTDHRTDQVHATNFIHATGENPKLPAFALSGLSITAPGTLAVPKVSSAAPCPCRSGLRYRDCHGSGLVDVMVSLEQDPVPVAASLGPRPPRNQPCPCGSGRKYKHCCGK